MPLAPCPEGASPSAPARRARVVDRSSGPRPQPLAPLRLALAACLSLGPAPAAAAPPGAPSERDLAYERAVQAEEAGDHVAAAANYERAYQLTAPAETGPRLLFLRASVAARLHAFAGSSDARTHLCPARTLLRDHLGATADLPPRPAATDPSHAERESLARIERQLASAGTDCTAAPDLVPQPPEPVQTPPAEPEPTSAPKQVTPAPPLAPASTPASLPAERPHVTRSLRIAGGATLGVGALGFALMTAGIVLANRATEDGENTCRMGQEACDASAVRDIHDRGTLANQLIGAGAVLGGLGLVSGVVMLAVSKRAGRPRVALTPALTPGSAALTLRGRF